MRTNRRAWARTGRRAVGAGGLVAVAFGLLGLGAGANAAEDACNNLTGFTALGSATAVRTVTSAPGYSIVTEGSINLGAQATVDTILGSKGWAGAPYVPQIAENAGQAKQDPNAFPIFASSDYPAAPKASNSTPAATVSAESAERSSKATAEGGGPGSDQAAAGRSVSSAEATCDPANGTLSGTSDTRSDMTSFGGVLRIGSVHSHAAAVRAANGEIQKLEGTMEVEGVTVLGQAVAFTDKGLVLGTSASPLPDNPLASALQSAGISVQYIAADKNHQTGDVTAPGLAVTKTQEAAAGGGPVSTTYTFGRAYALAAVTPGDALPSVDDGTFETPTGSFADTPSSNGSVSFPGSAPSESASTPAVARIGGNDVALPTAQIGSWSIAPAYSALGVGVLLLVVWFLLEKIAVRFQWR